MAGSTVSWDNRQEFLDATDLTVRSGATNAYVVPRRTGNSPQDVTSFHPGQAQWSLDHFPSVMYLLNPSHEWKEFAKSKLPCQKRDAQGIPIWVDHPNLPGQLCELLDFKILPTKIGTREEWWYFEAIRRLDPRVRWVDILMRMESQNRITANRLNNLAGRTWRPLYNMIAWHGTKSGNGRSKYTQIVIDALSQGQIAANSTRGSTPGLVNPALGRAGGWIDHPLVKRGRGEPRQTRGPRVRAAISSQTDQAVQASGREEEVDENGDRNDEENNHPPFVSCRRPSLGFDLPDLGMAPWQPEQAAHYQPGQRTQASMNLNSDFTEQIQNVEPFASSATTSTRKRTFSQLDHAPLPQGSNAWEPGQIAANSTRGSTPGLINPALGRAGGWIDHPTVKRGRGESRQTRGSRVRASISSQTDQAVQASDREEEVDENGDRNDEENNHPPFVSFRRPSLGFDLPDLGMAPWQPEQAAHHQSGQRTQASLDLNPDFTKQIQNQQLFARNATYSTRKRKISQLDDEPLPQASKARAPAAAYQDFQSREVSPDLEPASWGPLAKKRRILQLYDEPLPVPAAAYQDDNTPVVSRGLKSASWSPLVKKQNFLQLDGYPSLCTQSGCLPREPLPQASNAWVPAAPYFRAPLVSRDQESVSWGSLEKDPRFSPFDDEPLPQASNTWEPDAAYQNFRVPEVSLDQESVSWDSLAETYLNLE